MKNKIVSIVFILFILVFSGGSIIMKDRTFSDMENRYLDKFPEFTWSSLVKGEYTSKLESYLADQIIFKDFLVTIKVESQRAVNIKEVNQVFFCDDNRLIQDYLKPGEQLDKNISEIKKFTEDIDIPCAFVIVPNADYIYQDELPTFAATYNQEEVINRVRDELDNSTVVDTSETLMNHRDEYIYYRTDHHWTANGAYYGYCDLMEAIDMTPNPVDFYNISTVSSDFYGTLYSKVPTFNQVKDDIILYDNENGSYKVDFIEYDSRAKNSLYNYNNLDIKDKYTFYLDGNHPLTTIESNSDNKERVLVIKDSYAHSMVPFMADNFSTIDMIDLRYYHDSISKYIEDNHIDRIVMIYNVDFLSTDTNFLWLNH